MNSLRRRAQHPGWRGSIPAGGALRAGASQLTIQSLDGFRLQLEDLEITKTGISGPHHHHLGHQSAPTACAPKATPSLCAGVARHGTAWKPHVRAAPKGRSGSRSHAKQTVGLCPRQTSTGPGGNLPPSAEEARRRAPAPRERHVTDALSVIKTDAGVLGHHRAGYSHASSMARRRGGGGLASPKAKRVCCGLGFSPAPVGGFPADLPSPGPQPALQVLWLTLASSSGGGVYTAE